MDQEKFLNSIPIILNSKNPGYSFVKDYSEWIYDNKEDLNISHIITYWRLYKGDNIQDFYYYGGDIELVREGLDLSGMLINGGSVDTCKEEFTRFKGRNFWEGSHILTFPARSISSPFYNLKGVLVLISNKGIINFTSEQKSIIEILFNNTPPNDVSHPSVLECNQILTNNITTSLEIDEQNPECDQLYGSIINAIDSLSGKNIGREYGLRHYSQWEIMNKESKRIKLSKIFNHNATSDISHDNTYLDIDESNSHYLNSILDDFNKSSEKNFDLNFLPLSVAEASFKDKKYFYNIGLSKANGTVLSFIEREKNVFGSISGFVSCYYVKDFPYSIFTSPSVIISITQQIFKTIIRVGSYLNLKLLYCFAINFKEDSNNRNNFFKNISQLLAQWNSADECFIFQSQQEGRFQDMTNLDNEAIVCEGINSLDLPKRLTNDEEFVDFLNSISFTQGKEDLCETCNLYFNRDSPDIKSAMVLSSYLSSKLVNNILVFINRRSRISQNGTFYNDAFSYYCSLQTCLCGVFLYHYNLLLQSLDSKNYLLKKFRHEIPSCTDAIKESIDMIKNAINDGKPLKSANLLNILNMMDLNNRRVTLLAKFFSASGFDDNYFANNKIDTSFITLMNSYIETFRTEGLYRGVDVYFECRDDENNSIKDVTFYVSNFFLLSVTNVIINAIRYAAPGTCVNIVAYHDKIEVTDIGIPVRESEKSKIFNEGYRGQDARNVNEKGMGYGLYLSKRVIEAHNGSIDVESLMEFKNNYYLEKAIYNYYRSLPDEKKKKFLYFGIEDIEFDHANLLLSQIKKADTVDMDMSFLNNKNGVIHQWIEYGMNNNLAFIDYSELFFENDVYRVKFTIMLH